MTESARAAGSVDAPAEPSGPRIWRRAAAAAALLLLPGLVLCALYAPALDYDYAWTDTSAIGGGSMLRPAGEIAQAFREPLHRIPDRSGAARQSYYRPLQVVALSWVAQHFESKPRSFRSAGLVAGAACLALWAFVAWRLLGSRAAALAAALFVACHPVGIETYVWIAGGSGAICALFLLAALALGLASCRPRSRPASAGLGLLSLLALTAALLAKERAVVEPALLLALFAVASRSERGAAGAGYTGALLHRPRAAALFALQAALVLLYSFAWRPVVLGGSLFAQPPIGGTWTRHLASAVANWPGQLAWLFFPLHSSTSDVIRVVASPFDGRALLGASLALLSALACWLCLRHGRPLTALGIAWIWIAYAPTAGLLPLLHANGERYLFLSAFGAALIVADLAAALSRRTHPAAGIVLVSLALAFLAQRTSARLPEWKSNLGLFEQEIRREPAYREGYFLVAADLADRGRFAEAGTRLQPLLFGDPRFDGTASYLNPLSLNELACSVAFARRRYDEVLGLEQRLRREQPALLRAAPLRTCIGQANNALGHTRRAVELFTGVANELGPTTPPPLYVMIARAYLRLGETDSCRSWLQQARAAARRDPSLRPKILEIARQLARLTGPPPPRIRR